METVGKRLKFYRVRKKLSMKQVAEILGVPASTYRDWEYGKAIQGEPYAKLAEVLDINLIELLTGKSTHNRNLIDEIEKLENSVKTIKRIVLALG